MLYISPLKALAVDVERNLRAPLAGISSAVPQDTMVQIMDTARALLTDNVVPGMPAAIQTYRSLRRTGHRSDPSDSLWIYGRAGKPCRRCGTIESKKTGLDARTTYWCATCQATDSQTATD